MKTIHAGWFRCRIRGQAKSNYPWVYFHVTAVGSKVELRREARYQAGLYLHRQIFEVESVIYVPDTLTPVKTINGTVFYYQNAIAAVPEPSHDSLTAAFDPMSEAE